MCASFGGCRCRAQKTSNCVERKDRAFAATLGVEAQPPRRRTNSTAGVRFVTVRANVAHLSIALLAPRLRLPRYRQ